MWGSLSGPANEVDGLPSLQVESATQHLCFVNIFFLEFDEEKYFENIQFTASIITINIKHRDLELLIKFAYA